MKPTTQLKSATQSEKPTTQLKSSATKTETQNTIEIFCNKNGIC
jgi:hypothetical protein